MKMNSETDIAKLNKLYSMPSACLLQRDIKSLST